VTKSSRGTYVVRLAILCILVGQLSFNIFDDSEAEFSSHLLLFVFDNMTLHWQSYPLLVILEGFHLGAAVRVLGTHFLNIYIEVEFLSLLV